MTTDISLSDYLSITNTAFTWAKSYDTKNWALLQTILAPLTTLDFRSLNGALHENLSPAAYASILSGPHVLGDKRIMTQHLLGGAKWEKLADGSVHVEWQARVAHQRYEDEGLKVVVNKGHGVGFVEHWYREVEEGVWRIEGVRPALGWSEYDLFGTLAPEGDGERLLDT